MSFKTDLVTKRDMSENFARILVEPLVYENEQFIITVYPNFDYDGASIPWLFRRVLPREGMSYERAACLHDALYASRVFSKEISDKLFLEAMLSDGTGAAVANSMYKAVDWFGMDAYLDEPEEMPYYRSLVRVEVKNA